MHVVECSQSSRLKKSSLYFKNWTPFCGAILPLIQEASSTLTSCWESLKAAQTVVVYRELLLLDVGGIWTLTDMLQWFLIPAEISVSLVICPTIWLDCGVLRNENVNLHSGQIKSQMLKCKKTFACSQYLFLAYSQTGWI